MAFEIKRLGSQDVTLFHALNNLFGEVFEQPDVYHDNRPSDDYLCSLLVEHSLIALAAIDNGHVIAGLVAYELKKFEQQRSELYIYDLAVAEPFRRKGLATELIKALQPIAAKLGAWVIYVQADYEDEPAVALYNKLGEQEHVLHFDIPVLTTKNT